MPHLHRSNGGNGLPLAIVPVPVVKNHTQVPLRLAWAVTVHKSQSLALETARLGVGLSEVGLGKKEICRTHLCCLHMWNY